MAATSAMDCQSSTRALVIGSVITVLILGWKWQFKGIIVGKKGELEGYENGDTADELC